MDTYIRRPHNARRMKKTGILHFHSETGTEGGYWAFQDEDYMGLPNFKDHVCSICGRWWDKERHPGGVPPIESPGVSVSIVRRGDSTDSFCPDDQHEWRLAFPDGMWSHEGLHILKDGDRLTIFDKEDRDHVIWQGIVRLKQHNLFSETAFGFWIHADQKGEDREAWARLFFEEYPAVLEREDDDRRVQEGTQRKRGHSST